MLILELSALLRISSSTATTVFGLIMAGASAWAIICAVLAGGGVVALGGAVLRILVKKKLKELGEAAVIAW